MAGRGSELIQRCLKPSSASSLPWTDLTWALGSAMCVSPAGHAGHPEVLSFILTQDEICVVPLSPRPGQ